MKMSLLTILALLVACAKPQASPPNGPVAQQVAGAPCTVPVHEADSLSWREVQAEGFAFCVPATWKASSGGAWRGEDGSIRWGLGAFQPTQIATSITMTPMGPGNVVAAGTGAIPPPSQRYEETIGGASAVLTDMRLQAREYTTAEWPERKIWFEGTSGSGRVAQRQLAVYRTVHFTPATDAPTTSTPSPR